MMNIIKNKNYSDKYFTLSQLIKIINIRIIYIFIIFLLNINNVFATSLKIKCTNWEYVCHDHKIVACDQGSGSWDDYTGDYYARYSGKPYGHRCYLDGGNKNGIGENGTSDHCNSQCKEYGLFIGNKQIDTIEKFLEQIPVTELIKLYDPNMIP